VLYYAGVATKDLEPKSAKVPARHFKDASAERIYRSVMRTGGEPFFAPFDRGVSTLTERIVKLFKQLGFFGFETLERLRTRNRRNKFTRHGAAPYLGEHRKRP
jgi:hypothetical protein